jgi:hypothetical protein
MPGADIQLEKRKKTMNDLPTVWAETTWHVSIYKRFVIFTGFNSHDRVLYPDDSHDLLPPVRFCTAYRRSSLADTKYGSELCSQGWQKRICPPTNKLSTHENQPSPSGNVPILIRKCWYPNYNSVNRNKNNERCTYKNSTRKVLLCYSC